MEIRVKLDSQKLGKKLLEEKYKTITSLKKQVKIPVINHPQTEELLSLQEEVNSLQQSTLDLKEKVLQLENEKESLQKDKHELVLKVATTEKPCQMVTDELKKAMSQVILRMMKLKISKRRVIMLIKKIIF